MLLDLRAGFCEHRAGSTERIVYLGENSLPTRRFQISHRRRQIFVAHPLLNRAEVHARLKVHSRESRTEFVQIPVITARRICTGATILFAVAAVEFRPVSDLLTEIEIMVVRQPACGWEQERRSQALTGKETFERFH